MIIAETAGDDFGEMVGWLVVLAGYFIHKVILDRPSTPLRGATYAGELFTIGLGPPLHPSPKITE